MGISCYWAVLGMGFNLDYITFDEDKVRDILLEYDEIDPEECHLPHS